MCFKHINSSSDCVDIQAKGKQEVREGEKEGDRVTMMERGKTSERSVRTCVFAHSPLLEGQFYQQERLPRFWQALQMSECPCCNTNRKISTKKLSCKALRRRLPHKIETPRQPLDGDNFYLQLISPLHRTRGSDSIPTARKHRRDAKPRGKSADAPRVPAGEDPPASGGPAHAQRRAQGHWRACLSEALAVDDGRARVVVLLLRDPHLLEGAQRREDGPADPDRVLALGGRDDADPHRGRREGGHFALDAVRDAGEHGGATGQNDIIEEVAADVDVAPHDGVEGGLVDAVGLQPDQRRLEQNLWAAKALIADCDNLRRAAKVVSAACDWSMLCLSMSKPCDQLIPVRRASRTISQPMTKSQPSAFPARSRVQRSTASP